MHSQAFVPLNIAVLTVSDTRDQSGDRSGAYLKEAAGKDGHHIADYHIVKDEPGLISQQIRTWAADSNIHAALITGGTGFRARDVTVETLSPLFDKPIPGFGELFRQLSYQEIGASTIQSRACAGFIGQMIVFCLPGSTGACKTAWQGIISSQLNASHKPCNFVEVLLTASE